MKKPKLVPSLSAHRQRKLPTSSTRLRVTPKTLATCFCIFSLLPFSALSAEEKQAPRLAVLTGANDTAQPMASLLEVQLSAHASYQVLERDSISEIIKEWDLAMLSAAESVSKRAEIGRLLKADVLVMLSERTKPTPCLDLVVSETTRGLRLRKASFPKSHDQELMIGSIKIEIDAAINKRAEGLKGIYVVPPFVSEDLTASHGRFSAAYARLLEARLQEMPGILVVEIAEARKISEEMILTGSAVQREPPTYFLGEYRFDSMNRAKPPFLRITARQGAKDLWREELAQADPSTAVAFLQRSLEDHLASPGENPEANKGGDSEIITLNKRAQNLFSIGLYEECAQLAEASLLLDSQQPEIRLLVMSAYAQHCRKSMMPLLEELPYRWAALSHVEAFLNMTDLGHANKLGATEIVAIHSSISGNFSYMDRASNEERKQVMEFLRERREMFIQVMKAKHRQGRLNDAIVRITLTQWLLGHQFYGESLRDDLRKRLEIAPTLLAGEIQYKKNAIQDITQFGFSDDMKLSEDFSWFLNELSAIKHPVVTSVVSAERKVIANLKEGKTSTSDRTHPDKGKPIPTAGNVRFDPIRFTIPGDEELWLDGVLDCGNGTDILWGWSRAGSVFLMNELGILQPIHKLTGGQFGQVCFDGKYVWMPVEAEKSAVLAIDPQSGSVVQFTSEDGIPDFQFSACAPLGQGRLCFAGTFGVQSDRRSYIAVLELGTGGEKKAKIIHEATRQKLPNETEREAEMDVSLSYVAGFMISKRGESGKPWQVVLKRAFEHSCLSIEPDTEKVEAFLIEPHTILLDRVTYQNNRALWTAGGFLKCLRAGTGKVENLRKIPDIRHGTKAFVIEQKNLTHICGDHWWVSDGESGAFQMLEGIIPGEEHQRSGLFLSHHYGIIFISSTDKNISYQVILPQTLYSPGQSR